MATAHPFVYNQQSRLVDSHGSGQFGASRSGGSRQHKGLDIRVRPGDVILAPFDGIIVRAAIPYSDDDRFSGLVIKGIGEWHDYTIKIFYVEGFISGAVNAGQIIGVAQDIASKYPGITNHIHVEARYKRKLLSPFGLYQMYF